MSVFTFWLISCLICSSCVWVSSTFRRARPRSWMSVMESSAVRSVKFSTSMVVAMKFTRKWKFSMLRSAPMASLGAKDEDLTMRAAFSFSESARTRSSRSSAPAGTSSSM